MFKKIASSACLLAMSSISNGATITLNGQTYTISTFIGSYNGNIQYFNTTNMPWWGSTTDARSAAGSLGNQLGYPNWSNNFGPYFASIFVSSNTRLDNYYTSTNIAGTFDGYYLLSDSVTYAYIAPPPGPSAENTQAAIQGSTQALQNIHSTQSSLLINSLNHDCSVFGYNNICVSTGGSNTHSSTASGLNVSSGVVIIGYKLNPNYRLGVYFDQALSSENIGSQIRLSNGSPIVGIFGAWSEHADGTGAQVKLAGNYGQKNMAITRDVIGSGSTASEAGRGHSRMNSHSLEVNVSYGFNTAQHIITSPYIAIRYLQNSIGGYTEDSGASTTTPLSYSKLNLRNTSLLTGVSTSYKGISKTTLFANAAIEKYLNDSNGTYSATGMSGLTAVTLDKNSTKTHFGVGIGAQYDISKNQQIGFRTLYRQDFSRTSHSTSVLLTYTAGI